MEIDKDKLVVHMTANDLVELITSTIKETEKTVVKELPKFLTVQALSELTGYSISTINIKNCKKEIPGSKKINGRVLFDSEKILEWIDSGSVRTKFEQLEALENNFSKRKQSSYK